MANIEIRTAQNVVIAYETAPFAERLFAFLIDWAIGIGLCLVFLFLYALFAANFDDGFELLIYFCFVPVFFFYTLVSEVMWQGQSIGKKAMRLKVVKLTGREANVNDYLSRWVFRMIDIYLSAGSLAAILILSSSKGQRLGDILSNTSVVRIKKNLDLTVSDLLKMKSKDNYEPEYPQARLLKEEDALLIKAVLDRHSKYPNEASAELVKELRIKLVKELEIDNMHRVSSDFLKMLLRDYVVMSR